jgi:hypothetical protein
VGNLSLPKHQCLGTEVVAYIAPSIRISFFHDKNITTIMAGVLAKFKGKTKGIVKFNKAFHFIFFN